MVPEFRQKTLRDNAARQMGLASYIAIRYPLKMNWRFLLATSLPRFRLFHPHHDRRPARTRSCATGHRGWTKA